MLNKPSVGWGVVKTWNPLPRVNFHKSQVGCGKQLMSMVIQAFPPSPAWSTAGTTDRVSPLRAPGCYSLPWSSEMQKKDKEEGWSKVCSMSHDFPCDLCGLCYEWTGDRLRGRAEATGGGHLLQGLTGAWRTAVFIAAFVSALYLLYFLKPQGVAFALRSFASCPLQWNSGLTSTSHLTSVFISLMAFTIIYFLALSFSLLWWGFYHSHGKSPSWGQGLFSSVHFHISCV